VTSFGRRQAYESLQGTNPRCVVRGLWRFEILAVPGMSGVVSIRLPGTAAPVVLSRYRGTAPMPPAGKAGDTVWV
jgi:hypothetical protein